MSEDQLKAFLEKVQTDTELKEKLKATTNPDEAIVIAKEAGFTISAEDLKKNQTNKVSDHEIEGAAGGSFQACMSRFCGKESVDFCN